MIVYHIHSYLKYDNNKGMPMTKEDVDVVYSYCPQTLGYYLKRYGLKGLKNLCLTKRAAERRIKRLNNDNSFAKEVY